MSDLAATADVIATVDGGDSCVRIQVLTNAGALDRGKQLAVVVRLTKIAADAAGDPAAHRGPGRRLGPRRAREHERHAGGCRPDAGGVTPLRAIRGRQPA